MSETASLSIDPFPPPLDVEPPVTVKARLFRIAVSFLLVAIAAIAVLAGLRLRLYTFDQTVDIRFVNDARNAFNWGQQANTQGLFHVYDNDAAGLSPRNLKRLDYPPLRLAIAGQWVRWIEHMLPNNRGPWDRADYKTIQPLLTLNTLAELTSSIFIFMLIRMWRIREAEAVALPNVPRSPFLGVVPAMLGAMLFWFNPAVLWVGYAWPQWDIWLVPFFLGAVLLACVDAWFLAGACLAVAACLKGQILLAAPTLLLWPLFSLRFGAVLRLLAGLTLAFAIVIFPWLNADHSAKVWLSLSITSIALLAPIAFQWKLDWRWKIALATASFALAWPWTSIAILPIRLLPISIIITLSLASFLPRYLAWSAYGLVIAGLVFLTMPLYSASHAWYTVGFEFGTRKFMIVANEGTDNLPALLLQYFHYGGSGEGNPNFPVQVPLIGEVLFRNLMFGIYGACLLVAGIAATIHHRNRDPRFLLAIVLPWICLFALLTQLNNRYLVWAAGMSALLVPVSTGLTLLGLILSVIACLGMSQVMYTYAPADRVMLGYMNALNPQLGLIVVLIAAIYLYVAVIPGGRKRRPRFKIAAPAPAALVSE